MEGSEEEVQQATIQPTEGNNNQNNNNRSRGSLFRRIFGIKRHLENIKKGINVAKEATMIKAKVVMYVVVIPILVVAIMVFALEKDASAESTGSIDTTMASSANGGTNTSQESAKLYEEKGSLLLATDAQLDTISKNYLEIMENRDSDYYKVLNKEYSGKNADTVAAKVKHITTNLDTGEIKEVPVVENKIANVSGAANVKDKRKLYDHILRTEKYNFNSIVWRSFEFDQNKNIKQGTPGLALDSDSKLKYPAIDSNAENSDEQDIHYFISRVQPYLNIWYIPFDLLTGAETDANYNETINGAFAYEILASAYSQIVMDRYKITKLERQTSYRVYNMVTIVNETTRTCNYTETKGETTKVDCTYEEYKDKKTTCNDAKNVKDKINCYDIWNATKQETKKYGCIKKNGEVTVGEVKQESDNYFGKISIEKIGKDILEKLNISFGKKEVKGKTTSKVACTDITTVTIKTDFNVREGYSQDKPDEKANKIDDSIKEINTYSWNYVIAMVKALDTVINTKYTYEPKETYSADNYKNFINFKGSYKNDIVNSYTDTIKNPEEEYTNIINERLDGKVGEDVKADILSKVEEYRNYEKDNYKGISFTAESPVEYATGPSNIVDKNASDNYFWKGENLSNKKKSETRTVSKTTTTRKKGYSYIDKYIWADKLNYEESDSGTYNVESVSDVTGGNLSSSDKGYYTSIVERNELNTIDLMNADYNKFKNYISGAKEGDKIGYDRGYLAIAYEVLKDDLKDFLEKHPYSRFAYGGTIGIEKGSTGANGLSIHSVFTGGEKILAWPSPDIPASRSKISSTFKDASRGGAHYGIDIAGMSWGSVYIAPISGTIYSANDNCTDNYGKPYHDALYKPGIFCGGNSYGTGGTGNSVIIKADTKTIDGKDIYIWYMHLENVYVRKGDSVQQGQEIGTAGSTGASTWVHAHFQVMIGAPDSSHAVDPVDYIYFKDDAEP